MSVVCAERVHEMSTSYEPLFKGIRAKCLQERWFGPYFLSPMRRMQVPQDDPNHVGFVFPLACEEQVQTTETRLGVSFPPLLKALYMRIANGGFGPGGGFYCIAGGYGSVESGTHTGDVQTLIERYEGRSHKRTFNLAEYGGQGSHAKQINVLVPYGEWWRELLPLCNLGCLQEACVDCQERMFVVAPIERDDVYWLSQLPWTLEEWLWRWVKDEDLVEPYPLGAA